MLSETNERENPMGKVDVHPNRGYRSGRVRMQPKSDGDGDARRRRGKSLLSGKKSTFLEQHRLIKVAAAELCRFNRCTVHGLAIQLRMNRVKNLEHIEAKCSPLFVDYGGNRERKIFPNGSLSAYGACTQPAFRDHRSGCSVEQYLFARYRRTLRFAQLPCLTVQRETTTSKKRIGDGGKRRRYVYEYYPIECLRFAVADDVDGEQEQEEPTNETGGGELVVQHITESFDKNLNIE